MLIGRARGSVSDVGSSGDAMPPIDARTCFGAGLVKLCLDAVPTPDKSADSVIRS